MQYQTIKVRKEAHRLLKVLAAKNGESLLDLIDRLAKEEQERQRREDADNRK